MAGTFIAGLDRLSEQVGHGTLEARDVVDQVYAKYQELREDLNHPRGGKAHALRDAVIDHADEYMQMFADGLITPNGSEIRRAAQEVVHRIDERREENTPILFSNLIRSGHVSVIDDGTTIYDRPPDVPRLSDAQLAHQRRHGHDVDYGDPHRLRGEARER